MGANPAAGARGILLDIEGTTSSVSFVYEAMFPYARRETYAYLRARWGEPELEAALDQMSRDIGFGELANWFAGASDDQCREYVVREVEYLMDRDVKATGLKALQGLVWEAGFKSGELRAHLYDDVVPAIRRWKAAGADVRIYSSGSVHAQKLFFGHSVAGDLRELFSGWYDTQIGGKKSADSYRAIAKEFGMPAESILFVSDVTAELDAAREAGFRTALSLRPGNAPVAPGHGHFEIRSFDELTLGG